jgi:hypothetical protein
MPLIKKLIIRSFYFIFIVNTSTLSDITIFLL